MVRESKPLRQVATELGLDLTNEEIVNIERRKTFQNTLWAARSKFYNELAQNPERSKQTTIGTMLFLAQRLIEVGQYDKAAEVLFKAAKVEGHVGSENTTNIFNLTPQELEEARKKIQGIVQGGTTTPGSKPVFPN
jgi:hypothetical protein